MKIQMLQEGGYPVLVIDGEVSSHDISVVKAGLTKLLKNGKNKILLEFTKSGQLSQEILRELAMFNVLARELSGNIVIAGVDAATQSKIESYSKPPFVECFPTRAAAAAALAPKPVEEPPPPAAVAAAVAPAPSAASAKGADKSGALKELESQEKIRSELEKLKTRNAALEEQLRVLVIQRREPPDKEAHLERVRILEKELEDALARLKAAGDKAQ